MSKDLSIPVTKKGKDSEESRTPIPSGGMAISKRCKRHAVACRCLAKTATKPAGKVKKTPVRTSKETRVKRRK